MIVYVVDTYINKGWGTRIDNYDQHQESVPFLRLEEVMNYINDFYGNRELKLEVKKPEGKPHYQIFTSESQPAKTAIVTCHHIGSVHHDRTTLFT